MAFRDPVLGKASWESGARDRVAQNSSGAPWSAHYGQYAFTNFANPEVRAYNTAIAEEAGIDLMKVRFDPKRPELAAEIRKAAPNTVMSFSVPLVAAGANLSFWPLGPIFRRCGAFFLRRSFKGDRLYGSVFRAYVKRLFKDGFTQEFFIEGGRSRTGKTLTPKMAAVT